jgi:tetratricopeptide (TPR) repeat protein
MRRAALLLVLHAAVARAEIPTDANIDWKRPPPTKQEQVARQADALLARAREKMIISDRQRADQRNRDADASAADAARLADQAIEKYEQASKLGPPRAHLHYRAYVAARHYLNQSQERTHEKVIEHVTRFREVAPLDTRDFEVAEDLCHSFAKLAALRGGQAADALYERAIKEYDVLVGRVDPVDAPRARSLGTLYSNAAELLMASARLDEAIIYYERSVAADPQNPLNFYGLGVAYDRDGQVQKAAEAMRQAILRDPSLEQILHADEAGSPVYFVPTGDKEYYLALAFLVRGNRQEAIQQFERFLTRAKSAKKQYLDRAREHLRELKGGRAPR